MNETFKQRLINWTDIDVAQHELACCLGLMGPEVRFAIEAKHVYWSDNPVGNFLYETIMNLVKLKILEYITEPDDRVRWNPSFRGSWERNGDTVNDTEGQD